MDNNELSDAQRRRKRINLYKKIIIIIIVVLILLPSILCAILFCKVSNLNNEIKELRSEAVLSAEKEEPAVIPEQSSAENTSEPVTEMAHANAVTETTESHMETEAQPEETTTAISEMTDKELVAQALNDGRKVVYLTFDDGPCENTGNLLDVLDKYGVKATFFVNGYNSSGYEPELQRIVNEGHSLAMHTYSHNYEIVYSSLECFENEVVSLQDLLYNVTGFSTRLFRFPGGSSNSQTQLPIDMFIDYLNAQNIVYFDWNVSSGDGGSRLLTPEEVCNNVINGVEGKDVSVVLMHDSIDKLTTYQAVPMIIEKLQADGTLILPITDDTEPVHHNIK